MKQLLIMLQLFILTTGGYCQIADTVSLNGSWKFRTDRYNKGRQQKWYRPGLDDSGWDHMEVPGNWDLHDEYAEYKGKAWYRTSFMVPKDWGDKNVRLVFGGVYNDCNIWLNGHKIGSHNFGYLRFYFDVSPYLKVGQSNELVLQVDNTFKIGAIWDWGGIRRPVWLDVTNKIRLNLLHITAVPNLKDGSANIGISFEVDNKTRQTQKINYNLEILKKGKVVWNSNQQGGKPRFTAGENGITQKMIHFRLPASEVSLWSFNNPNLYEARIQISKGGQKLHQMNDRFGIRKIEVDDEQLKLNGEPIRPVGFNLVPEDRTTGSTLPLWRIKKDVDMMKTAGANMARLIHFPLPKSFLDYLDQKGIMVIEEVSVRGKDRLVNPKARLPEYILKTMIRQEYNHPCIIGWSAGDEIGYKRKNPKAMQYVEKATNIAQKLDSTRLTEYVTNSAQNQKDDPVKYGRLILQNSYGGWGQTAKRTHEYHPGKPIFMSEVGKNLNSEDPNKGTINADEILEPLRFKKYVIGASLWTFNDYRSHFKSTPSWTTDPSENRAWGVVNVFRQKKRAFYSFQRAFLPFKKVDIQHSITNFEPGKDIVTTLKLGPRNSDDFPVYKLNGYRLAWRITNTGGKVVDGGFDTLPEMNPGGNGCLRSFNWKVPEMNGEAMKISILDPLSYAVYDTTFYTKSPEKPEILSVHSGDQGIRVVYKKVSSAARYVVRYGTNRLSHETEPTINNFIDIDGLEHGQTYKLQLAAINNAGETVTSSFEATIDEDELPPIIWHTEPSDSSFFVGYSVSKKDMLFRVVYGEAPGVYTDTLTLQNKGVCQIPGLKEGKTYYYKLRRHDQLGFASEWSREIEVTTGQEVHPEAPVVHGLIRKGGEAILFFEPVHKAVGYSVRIETGKGKPIRTVDISAAYVTQLCIPGLDSDKDYRFAIQTRTSKGKSNFVPVEVVKNQ